MMAHALQPLRRACAPILLGALGLLLIGCAASPQPTPQQRAAIDACRSQAEQQFNIQNRASLFQTDTSLTPYTGQGPFIAPTQNLANQFAHRQMVQACLRGATGPAPAAPTTPAPVAPTNPASVAPANP